jgi:ABC-type uncharacterized transport system auxiliary subunit
MSEYIENRAGNNQQPSLVLKGEWTSHFRFPSIVRHIYETGCQALLIIGLLAMGISMVACSPFQSAQKPPTVYALQGASVGEKQDTVTPRAILVPEPHVPTGFDTNKIALYLYNKRRLDYYSNAVWADRLGNVLQGVILQTVSNTAGLMGVIPGWGLPASEELLVTVNDFEPVFAAGADGIPQLKVSLNYQVVSLENGKLLRSATFSETAPAAANTQTSIVSGLETLLKQVNARAMKRFY